MGYNAWMSNLQQSSLFSDEALPPAVAPAAPARELAPMLKQYLAVKERYPDFHILIQVGDFYEVFFDDAKVIADALNIRLTSRDKSETDPIPMAGVPIHALDNYLPRLLERGLSCVLVSQVESADTKFQNGKKVGVQREITRIITPGIRFEGDGLDEKRYNFLAAALVSPRGAGAVGLIDVSAGMLRLIEIESKEGLVDTLRKFAPSELLLPSIVDKNPIQRDEKWIRSVKELSLEHGFQISFRPYAQGNRESVANKLSGLLLDQSRLGDVEKLSLESLFVVSGLLDYVESVSLRSNLKISRFELITDAGRSCLDAASIRNLEILSTRSDGARRNSLLDFLDQTKTPMGSRLLTDWVLNPLTELEPIRARHAAVEELLNNPGRRDELIRQLQFVRDIDRLVTRVALGRGNPRDLSSVRESLAVLPQIKDTLGTFNADLLKQLVERLNLHTSLKELLNNAITDEPPLKLTEPGTIRPGYSPELDELNQISTQGSHWIVELEARERQRTGIPSLKIKYNNIFGYFIEITNTHVSRAPTHYERKQTLANAERFTIPELKEFEGKVLSAKAKALELEKKLFSEVCNKVAAEMSELQISAEVLATLDVLLSFAESAARHSFCRPEMTLDEVTEIVGGRHPVVESVIGSHNYVANDASLNTIDRAFAVLTGPNMGGKSTYLRMVGIVHLMAQTGSFVPARAAKLGIVDRIFTRIGSADDLVRGESTFMVEMKEATAIALKATRRSLVLVDEVGRGTATTDGLAIARALAEWLHDDTGCRTIFATHFHELTELPSTKERVFCLSVGVVEDGDHISFTHVIEHRAADRSYGIEVAKLAGLPTKILTRAKELLNGELLNRDNSAAESKKVSVKSFPVKPSGSASHPKEQEEFRSLKQLVTEISSRNIDEMTPMQSLVELSAFQKRARELQRS